MKSYLWIVAVVIPPSFAACNRTVGECWPRGQGDESGGVGSGPVIASGGTGDYGDSPPNPSDFKIPEADCNIAEQSPCTEKCLTSYETAATTCAKIPDDAQRKTCQDGAYQTYHNCKAGCSGDPVEECKKLCDKVNQDCIDHCPPGNKSCFNECNQAYGKCLKDCGK